jgi:hypothetical protein
MFAAVTGAHPLSFHSWYRGKRRGFAPGLHRAHPTVHPDTRRRGKCMGDLGCLPQARCTILPSASCIVGSCTWPGRDASIGHSFTLPDPTHVALPMTTSKGSDSFPAMGGYLPDGGGEAAAMTYGDLSIWMLRYPSMC